MHYKMLVESKIPLLKCWFSVILMFPLFLGKISCFPTLISLVHNFSYCVSATEDILFI